MSDLEVTVPEVEQETAFTEDERAGLIRRADVLGVQFHPNISTDKLRERVTEALRATASDVSIGQTQEPTVEATAVESENARRLRLRAEASKLVRVQITCMDPSKKEYQGEIITAGNSVVGSYRKFVLFNEPYHIPQIILSQLEEKQCQIFVTVKGDRGQKHRQGKLIKAYAIQKLPPLTTEELKELADDQRARKAI